MARPMGCEWRSDGLDPGGGQVGHEEKEQRI
jgi:hypothetical protein